MRKTSIRRSRLVGLALGVGTALAVLVPGTAQASDWSETASVDIAREPNENNPCTGTGVLTVWKKGVQRGQIWSNTSVAGGCEAHHYLHKLDVNGNPILGQSFYATSTTNAVKNVTGTLAVGESYMIHSVLCHPSQGCLRLHWGQVKRIGPSTNEEDWEVSSGKV